MNLRLLKIFKLVYEEESITEASKRLYISQPAVSQAIQELEIDLDRNLFIRDAGVLRRSPFSHDFYTKVVALLNQFDDLEKFAKKSTRINMSSSMTLVKTTLPSIMKQYEMNNHRTLNVTVVNAKEVVRRVLKHEDDLGIVEGKVSHSDLEIKEIDHLELCFFVAKDQNSSKLTLDQLLSRNILSRDKGSSIRDVFDETLKSLGKSYQPSWESVNSEAICVAVENHLGLGLLPKILIDLEKFQIIEIENLSLNTPVSIIYRKNKKKSHEIQELVETIEEIYG